MRKPVRITRESEPEDLGDFAEISAKYGDESGLVLPGDAQPIPGTKGLVDASIAFEQLARRLEDRALEQILAARVGDRGRPRLKSVLDDETIKEIRGLCKELGGQKVFLRPIKSKVSLDRLQDALLKRPVSENVIKSLKLRLKKPTAENRK